MISTVFCISFSCAAGTTSPPTKPAKKRLRSRGVEITMPTAPETEGSISVAFFHGAEVVTPDPPPTQLRLALVDATTRREAGW
ncbi:hypothetical protein [Streptomyces sp. NPDC001880]